VLRITPHLHSRTNQLCARPLTTLVLASMISAVSLPPATAQTRADVLRQYEMQCSPAALARNPGAAAICMSVKSTLQAMGTDDDDDDEPQPSRSSAGQPYSPPSSQSRPDLQPQNLTVYKAFQDQCVNRIPANGQSRSQCEEMARRLNRPLSSIAGAAPTPTPGGFIPVEPPSRPHPRWETVDEAPERPATPSPRQPQQQYELPRSPALVTTPGRTAPPSGSQAANPQGTGTFIDPRTGQACVQLVKEESSNVGTAQRPNTRRAWHFSNSCGRKISVRARMDNGRINPAEVPANGTGHIACYSGYNPPCNGMVSWEMAP
jgi:hypothetical protein